MLDERTRRASERAAAARQRAFDTEESTPTSARPLGVVPILLLCVVGAVIDGYAVIALELGPEVDVVNAGMVAFALVAAFALATEQSWTWTITWMYLALHVFVDIITATMIGPLGLALAVVYGLALTYATGRRAVEATERGASPSDSAL
jgi:hypothetical protein